MVSEGKKVCFVHIGKTGGVTLETLLKNAYKGKSVCPFYTNEEMLLSNLDLDRYHLFLGHVFYSVYDLISSPKFVFTFLRDPVRRVISAYEHIKRDKLHKMHCFMTSEDMCLADFLRVPELRKFNSDTQVRFLANELHLLNLSEQILSNQSSEKEVLLELEESVLLSADDGALDRACRAICRMDFVGFTEYFESDVFSLFEKIGADESLLRNDHGKAVPRLNVNPRGPIPSDLSEAYSMKDISEAESVTVFDRQLYQYAFNRFKNASADV